MAGGGIGRHTISIVSCYMLVWRVAKLECSASDEIDGFRQVKALIPVTVQSALVWLILEQRPEENTTLKYGTNPVACRGQRPPRPEVLVSPN